MKNNSVLIAISIMASMGMLAGCGQAPVESRAPTIVVEAMTIERSGVESQFHFAAEARASDKTPLSFRIGGEITKIHVKAGELVKEGQLIATLAPTDYEIALDDAQARYGVIDSQYRRSSPLVEKGFLSQAQFDEIKAQRAIELSQLNIAKLQLSFTELRSPFDGVISKVHRQQAENVQAGEALVNLHRTDSVEIIVQAPDSIYATKTPAEVHNEKPTTNIILSDGGRYEAAIKEFTTEPDPRLGSYVVTLEMPMPEDNLILDGMPVEVESDEDQYIAQSALDVVLPISAIFNEDGDTLAVTNKFVWIIQEDKTVEKRHVVLGNLMPQGIRVLSGVELGDRIVISGVNRLKEGWMVEATESGKEMQSNES